LARHHRFPIDVLPEHQEMLYQERKSSMRRTNPIVLSFVGLRYLLYTTDHLLNNYAHMCNYSAGDRTQKETLCQNKQQTAPTTMNQLPPFDWVVSMNTPVHAVKSISTMKVRSATGNPARPL
jgi:hypothetical protein